MREEYEQRLAEIEPHETLHLGYCRTCGKFHWYPRRKCPLCHSFETELREGPSGGTIHTCTVMRRSADGPFAAAYVDLIAGPRVLVRSDAGSELDLRIGQEVKVCNSVQLGFGGLRLAIDESF